MIIYIQTLAGKRTELDVDATADVKFVKWTLQEKEGIAMEQIKLIYSGKQLADDVVLSHVGCKAGDSLHMVLQLRGGL